MLLEAPALGRYLAEDEQAVLEMRRHPFVLLKPAATALAALVGASAIGALVSWEDGSDFVDTVVGLVAIFFVVRLMIRMLLWWADRIVVTNHRIFEVSGVLARKVASMPLERVTDMTYRRSLGGRLFGYGELVLESAGQAQALERICHLRSPDDFYRTVTSLVMGQSAPSRVLLDETPGPEDDDTGPLPRIVL